MVKKIALVLFVTLPIALIGWGFGFLATGPEMVNPTQGGIITFTVIWAVAFAVCWLKHIKE